MTLRTCTCCGMSLPETLEFFAPNKGSRGGMHTYCIQCKNKKAREKLREARAAQLDELAEEITLPPGDSPVHRVTTGGVTRVMFRKGWNVGQPGRRTEHMQGYSSALTRI